MLEVTGDQAAVLILFTEVTHVINRLLKSFRPP